MQSPTISLSARAQTTIFAVLVVWTVVTLSPIADALVPALPMATGEVRWRFQVFGTVLAALPQLALLLAAITAVGTLSGYRAAVRGAAVAALLLAVFALILLPFFGLDFIEMRRVVALDRKQTFDIAAMKTGAFGILLVPALAYLGWMGFLSSPSERRTPRKKGLVVGQDEL